VLDLPRVGVNDSFFDLGGHSLLAARLVNRIRSQANLEVTIQQVFTAPTPAGLARELTPLVRPALRPAARPERVPLSPTQRRLWFTGIQNGLGWPLVLRLSGELDAGALRAALADVVDRHEALRTVFPEADGQPYQRVLDGADVLEIAGPGFTVADAERHVFDLTREVPLGAWLFPAEAEERLLVLVLHHIAGDGWSLVPLARDLSLAYAARAGGREPGWEPLPVQYADYALWQRDLLGDQNDPGSVFAAQLGYWREHLAGLPEELALPYDRLRPVAVDHEGGVVPVQVPPALHAGLLEVARGDGATLFMVLHAAVAALLTRLGAGTDIPLGTGVAGRLDEALDELVGVLVNMLVLRADTSGDPTFRELLGRVRETDLAAYDHQDLPFESVVEALNPPRSLTRHPLFQAVVILQNNAEAAFDLPGIKTELVRGASRQDGYSDGPMEFDLLFDFYEGADGLAGQLRFRRDIFDRATAEAVGARLVRLLGQVAADPDVRVEDTEVLLPGERETMTARWNDTAQPVPGEGLAALFAGQAARTPDAPAVSDAGRTLSYAELDQRANHLAHRLLAAGAGPDEPVAVSVPRSADYIVSVLAVLKAGGCYLPLPDNAPESRIRFMLEQARARVLVAGGGPSYGLGTTCRPGPGTRADPPAVAVHPDQAAYIMYTSGSTGTPKGIAVTQRAVAGFALDRRWQDTEPHRVLMHATTAFDPSTFEIWMPLLTGGTVVVAPPGELDTDVLAAVISEGGATTAAFTPPVFNLMAEEAPDALSRMRLVWTAGDVVSAVTVGRLLARQSPVKVAAAWGTTETTIISSWYPVTAAPGTPVPIGSPMDNVRLYVLDGRLRPAPPGTAGEIYAGGAGLARCYVAQPGLTAERFVADPYGPPGARLYRTGDRGRWLPGGILQFAGRTDSQLKIRGYRVEPAEVEAALLAHPDVAQAAVIAREDRPGDRRLVAYLVPAAAALDPSAVRAHAAAALPSYAVPTAIVALTELPLTPNGKLDRTALPAPAHSEDRTPPRTPQEHQLCTIFADILNIPHVGIHDNFFDLGGHSLLATRLVNRIRADLGRELSVDMLFDEPTVATLSSRLSASTPASRPPLLRRAHHQED
jgi:pristinamycin I synthase-3/4